MSALLTLDEAAAALGGGMTVTRLRTMAQRGDIGSRRDGPYLRFTQADIDEYVASIARPRRMATTKAKARR